MKPIINSQLLIGSCGLYCAACRLYRKGRCPGCWQLEVAYSRRKRCRIRKCCHDKGYDTCAECCIDDVKNCRTYNTLTSRIYSFFFNSDRAACIRYIRHNGTKMFAEKMSWNEQMTMRRQ